VVGVLIAVPVMLWLVRICLRTPHWFPPTESKRWREVWFYLRHKIRCV